MAYVTFKVPTRLGSVRKAFIACFFAFATKGHCLDTLVNSKIDLTKAEAALAAGDTLTLADGNWDDVEIKISAVGTATQPILIRAQTPGKAILGNSSHVTLDGKYIVVSGLLLQGTSTRSGDAVVFTANSSQCRLTQTAIEGFNSGAARDDWVTIGGYRNRVDYCSFTVKKNVGICLRLSREGVLPDGHVIAHNYFGARAVLNGNGAEEIQLGLKETQFTESRTTVEYNLFEDCNGELENVSVKSGGDTLRFNTFARCQSHLTLRHGSGSVVEGNYIDGQGTAGTGGIRICGKNHVIVNNFMTGLRGADEYGGGVNIHGGDATDPKADPANHVPAGNCLVAYNTLVDNREGIVYGGQGGTPPTGITLANNIVMSGTGTLITMTASTPFAKLDADILSGANPGIAKQTGLIFEDPKLDKTLLNGYTYYLPGYASPASGKAVGGYLIPGWPGPLPPPDIGENLFGPSKLKPLSRAEVGPAWQGGPALGILPAKKGSRKPTGYLESAASALRISGGLFDVRGRLLTLRYPPVVAARTTLFPQAQSYLTPFP